MNFEFAFISFLSNQRNYFVTYFYHYEKLSKFNSILVIFMQLRAEEGRNWRI